MRSLSPSPAQPQNPLTREKVVEKHNLKGIDINQVKKMNMFDFKIDSIALVREMPALEIVSLSENRISTLRDLAHCPNI
jgi:cilla- and flagella-associated protein